MLLGACGKKKLPPPPPPPPPEAIAPTASLFSAIAVSAVHFNATDGSGSTLSALPIRRWYRDDKLVFH